MTKSGKDEDRPLDEEEAVVEVTDVDLHEVNPTLEDILDRVEPSAKKRKPLSDFERQEVVNIAEMLQKRYGISPVAVLIRSYLAESKLREGVRATGEDFLEDSHVVKALSSESDTTDDVIFSPSLLKWISFLRACAFRQEPEGPRRIVTSISGEIEFLTGQLHVSEILREGTLGKIADAFALRQKGSRRSRRKPAVEVIKDRSAFRLFRSVLGIFLAADKSVPRGIVDPVKIREAIILQELLWDTSDHVFADRLAADLAHHRTTTTHHLEHMTLRQRAAVFLWDVMNRPHKIIARRPPYSARSISEAETLADTLEKNQGGSSRSRRSTANPPRT